MSYTISFCLQEEWKKGLVGSRSLISSILHNTSCKDIRVYSPTTKYLMKAHWGYLFNSNIGKLEQRDNPIKEYKYGHKLNAFDYKGDKNRVYVDTNSLFYDDVDDIFDWMSDNNIDILAGPVKAHKNYDNDKAWKKLMSKFNLEDIPKKNMKSPRGFKTGAKSSPVIFLRDVPNFSKTWIWVAKKLIGTWPFDKGYWQLTQVALTITIEYLNLNHSPFPPSIKTDKTLGHGVKKERNGDYKVVKCL